jgi:dihydroneopterin aldolase
MEKTGIIELEGMEFHAFHGVLEHEKIEGNLFIVDFKGEVDMSKAAESDLLEDTLNYALIYDAVAKQMQTPSELLEHVAGRIVRAIAADCPQLESFSVRVSKRQPPVAGPVKWSRVTLFHKRYSTEK